MVSSRPIAHLAIIMDGNGRWAQKKMLNRIKGHKVGKENLKNILQACAKHKIQILSIFAFSTENFGRPKEEVDALISLLLEALVKERSYLIDNKIALNIIGDLTFLDSKIQIEAQKTLEASQKAAEGLDKSDYFTLNLAINYGGKADIVQATKSIASKVKAGDLKLEEIDESLFSNFLSTEQQPEPDLLIRTGGHKRISNFMLWQLAYTELYFSDALWPDFSINEFEIILEDFSRVKRNFGNIKE